MYRAYYEFRRHHPRRKDQARCRAWFLHGLLAAGAAASLACLTLDPPPPRSAAEFTASRELVELDRLPALRAAADAEPESLRAQWQAGMAHLRACLQGHVDQRDLAEHYLERAWRLDPQSQQVPVARTLGRFLNMRSAVLDLDRIDLQIAVYDSLLADPELDAATRLQFSGFKAAAEAVPPRQWARIGAAATRWLAEETDGTLPCRFDLVLVDRAGRCARIENAASFEGW